MRQIKTDWFGCLLYTVVVAGASLMGGYLIGVNSSRPVSGSITVEKDRVGYETENGERKIMHLHSDGEYYHAEDLRNKVAEEAKRNLEEKLK